MKVIRNEQRKESQDKKSPQLQKQGFCRRTLPEQKVTENVNPKSNEGKGQLPDKVDWKIKERG